MEDFKNFTSCQIRKTTKKIGIANGSISATSFELPEEAVEAIMSKATTPKQKISQPILINLVINFIFGEL